MFPTISFYFLLIQGLAVLSIHQNQLTFSKKNHLQDAVVNLQNENALLRNEVTKIEDCDLESNVTEMMKILEAHGQDITDLRILVGHLLDDVANIKNHLSLHDSDLVNHGDRLNAHDQKFIEHHSLIEANTGLIGAHSLTLTEHQASIQANFEGVTYNGQRIQENQNGIATNAQNIQIVSDNFNNFQYSLVKFHVESDLGFAVHWPSDSTITYIHEVLDTHNAMDPASGYFTAPIAGTYGFFFTAVMYKRAMDLSNNLHVRVNDNDAKFFNFQYDLAAPLETIYFVLNLNAGDRVNMFQANGEGVQIQHNPATFMGFLMQKF